MGGWVAGVAMLAWLIGALVLGRDWQGHEISPGVWADGVSLTRWATCWVVLAVVAAVASRVLRRWTVRLLALLPLITWIAWQLRAGTLGPIPMAIYIVPTTAAWCAGLLIGDLVRRRLARSVYHS